LHGGGRVEKTDPHSPDYLTDYSSDYPADHPTDYPNNQPHLFLRGKISNQPPFSFHLLPLPSFFFILAPFFIGHQSKHRAANNFPAGAGQIIRSNQFLLGHIPFLAGQTSIIIIILNSKFFPYQPKRTDKLPGHLRI